MTFIRLLVPVCWLVASVVGDPGTGIAVTNSSSGGLNGTRSGGKSSRGFDGLLRVDSSMMQRALYVLIGITVIGVLYFLVRAVR